MKYIHIIAFSVLSLLLFSCGDSAPEEAHEHTEEKVLSYTIWTDKSELFVEFQPLILNEVRSFAAHFSEMENFKAVTEGKVTISLIQGDKGVKQTVDAPASPGIFKPTIQPINTGLHTLIFEIETSTFKDKIVIENVPVFASMEEALKQLPAEDKNPNEISFLKEQAWKMEFANAPAIMDTIYDVIKTGGEILPAKGDEKTVVATANGIVVYNTTDINIGAPVKGGQGLFTISSGNVTDNNIETEFLKAKSNYILAKSNYDRKLELYESKAVSKKDFEEAQLAFEIAESEYNNLAKSYSKGGKGIAANSNGFIKELYRTEGEYVQMGEPLALITQNEKLTLRADVSQVDFGKLNPAMTANFKSNNTLFNVQSLNGKLTSFGKSVDPETNKIPVFFELSNIGNLLSGSFAEVWIKTNVNHVGLIVPNEALLEDYGQYSVIVQTGGESFEKRNVTIGVMDGKNTEILSGIEPGERVVTKGAFQVKMASMSGQVPAHGHVH